MTLRTFVEEHWKEELALGAGILLGRANLLKTLPEIFGKAASTATARLEQGAVETTLGRELATAELTGEKLGLEASHRFGLAQPGKELEIRAMTPSDLPSMRALMEKTEGLAFRPEETTAALKRALESNPGLSQAAFHDGKLVGGVFIGETGLRGMINHLAVAPESRGTGIGSQLVQSGLRALYEQTPVRRVYASVLSGNDRAMKFWSTLGRNATGSDPKAEVSIFIFDLEKQPWLKAPIPKH